MNSSLVTRIATAIMVFALSAFAVREPNYYVVIGAFAKETNARKFTGFARNLYLDAYYKFNPQRNLYYVHVMETSRKEEARNWSLYLKHETGFKDAWVFTESPGGEASFASFDQSGTRHATPRYAGSEDQLETLSESLAISTERDAAYNYGAESEAVSIKTAWTTLDEVSFTNNLKNNPRAVKGLGETKDNVFTFLAETSEGKMVPAEVMLVDYKKAKRITGFQTGEYIGLRGKSRNQTLTFVCDVFGYSVETKVLNLEKLSRMREVKQNSDGVWEVKFKLKPMKKNEISILYNTVFFTNAAVLKPSSQKQVDELLQLMKANPSYKILIHSHCNPSGKRDIRIPGKSGNYFDLESSVHKNASDKQLTKQRAEIIRSYLVANGIDSKRVGVFGWGSLDNLVSPSSADPSINERVEVELVEN